MNLNQINLVGKIRPVEQNDWDRLPKYSYSGLSVLKQCPYQFNLKYNLGKRSEESTLALQLGTLLHYVLEQKGKMIRNKVEVDYDSLRNILINGTTETDDKTQEPIKGLTTLKKEYWETWGIADSEGRTYDEKIKLFMNVLENEMERDDWTPCLFEHPFDFVYDNKIILHGFIDRVDINMENGQYRVVDYKTNKKPFRDEDLPTALQFGIYALAIVNEFGTFPVEYQYRLILLDMDQYALTSGWESRFIKAMDKLLNLLDESKASNEWLPKPTPLCYWCSYCHTNPDAKEFKDECPYYSLWTPDNKVFDVNMKYDTQTKSKYVADNTLQKPRTVVF